MRKLIVENGLEADQIPATGKGGRLLKGDVLAYLEQAAAVPAAPSAEAQYPPRPAGPREERVRMSRLRQMVARRLKEAQNTAAMLTTFNEVDMTEVMALRAAYRDAFEKKHGVRIGFMSLFVKASVVALGEFPAVNAEIDEGDIVYKTTTSASPSARPRAWWCRWCATATPRASPKSRAPSGISACAPGTASSP